jgi:5'-nucleotidase
MGRGRWVQEWISANNPRGMNAFWLTGRFLNLEPHSEDTDYWALDHGYGSITPIQIDMTAYSVMDSLKFLES